MPQQKIRILSVAMAGGLAFAGVTAAAIANTGHAPARAALAANMASSPPVNLDNCPTMALGYQGGCASQLQQELTNNGDTVPVDGIFGPGTQRAVENFQQEHHIIPADGIVGPQTKVVLDNPDAAPTTPTPGQLDPGGQITSGTQIASPDGEFVLQMQSDGNLVFRGPGNVPLGDTHTAGHDGAIAVMQADGNFVIRAPGNVPVWASGTDGHPGTVLQVQDDGRVVLYAPGHQVLRVLFPAPAPAPPASAPAPPASASQAPSTPSPISSQGTDDAVAISPGQTNCTDYSQGALWQTSTNWARVRYQPCLQESNDGSTVTPIINVQFDWPVKDGCSLSVGFPPSASLDCPLTVLAKPGHKITFQAYTSYNSQPVDFEIPLEITGPGGLAYSAWCYYNPSDKSTNTSTYGGGIIGGGRNTLTCNGPTYPRLIGTYTVGSLGPRGDVENDGADARILTAGQMQFVSS
jgi:peptidoglycan hydrolase-like protein with peptidoglycan-binding domain